MAHWIRFWMDAMCSFVCLTRLESFVCKIQVCCKNVRQLIWICGHDFCVCFRPCLFWQLFATSCAEVVQHHANCFWVFSLSRNAVGCFVDRCCFAVGREQLHHSLVQCVSHVLPDSQCVWVVPQCYLNHCSICLLMFAALCEVLAFTRRVSVSTVQF